MQVRSEPRARYDVSKTDPEQVMTDDDIISMAMRILERRLRQPTHQFTSPDQVKQYLSLANSQYSDQDRERFGALFLDSQHGLICLEIMFEGTLSQTSVYPREIVRRALQLNAAAVIFTHNHPSGCLEFSHADVSLTQTLKSALALVDVRVLDHILTAPGPGTVSMAEQGRL